MIFMIYKFEMPMIYLIEAHCSYLTATYGTFELGVLFQPELFKDLLENTNYLFH
jgi:hypothetical protein